MAGFVKMKVSAEMLRQALNLPDGVSIERIDTDLDDYTRNVVTVLLHSEEFDPATATDAPQVLPTITKKSAQYIWDFAGKELVADGVR